MRPVFLSLFLALPAHADVPAVMADIAPVQSIAAAVMGDLGTPDLLISGAADPHHMQLRPSEARRIANADLILWVGPELTPWLTDTLAAIAPQTPTVALMSAPGSIARPPMFAEDDHGHDHGHSHDHDDEDGAADAHTWLDPVNAAAWADAIAQALADADPANAATYRSNAAALRLRLDSLTTEAAEILMPVKDRAVIVQHDAYAHFADRFGLSIAGSISDSDAAGPGTATMIRLSQEMQAGGIACLFTEAQESTDLAVRLVEGTRVRLGQLDPLGSMLAPGPDLYGALILGLARDYAACAGGD